jgi:hypothetical protein
MPQEQPELYVTLGRLEEGMRFVRESQERMERKIDAQDARINEIELDVKELKTHRANRIGSIAIGISLISVLVSLIVIFVP